MKSQLVPGVLGLLQPVPEGGVHHITLPAQVTGCLEQDSVHQGLQHQGIVKAMAFLPVMYGCEIWTLKIAEGGRIDAFNLCCW